MSKEIAKTSADKYKGIKKLFHDSEQAIMEVMPDDTDFKRMVGGLLMQTRVNPTLLDCTGESILVCGLTVLGLGLETNPAFHQVAIVPFGRSVKVGAGWMKIKEAQVMIEYRGFITLAIQSGEVITINTYPVYENEIIEGLFTIEYGLKPNIIHKPTLRPEQRGEIAGVYAVALFRDGTTKFHYMWLEDVYKRRDVSKAWQNDLKLEGYRNNGKKVDQSKFSPWTNWETEQILKTAIKGLARTLQLSPKKSQFNRAVTLDNLADVGKSQIPNLTKEIEISGIEIPGTFNETEPDPEEMVTMQDSDFGKATEGEGDPLDKIAAKEKEQNHIATGSPPPLNSSPQTPKKEEIPSDSEIEKNRELIKITYNLLRDQDKLEIVRQIFPDEPQRRKIGKWDTMPAGTLTNIYNILHTSPLWGKAKEVLKQNSPAKEKPKENNIQEESSQTIRDRVINWMRENSTLHNELEKKLIIIYPECKNIAGYFKLDYLSVEEWISNNEIKVIDDTIREAGLYK